MKYTKVTIHCKSAEQSEIAIAALSDLPFDSFHEEGNVLYAYSEATEINDSLVKEALNSFGLDCPFDITQHKRENWNKTWEDSFEPVEVKDWVHVRATFHQPPVTNCDYELVIDPKMSFGTGHHHTTYLMMAELYQVKDNVRGVSVLDMGCGTGILGILAAKMNATSVHGIDIDPWCIENSMENIELNGVENMTVAVGDVTALNKNATYDIILANINRNILLSDMDKYVDVLGIDGLLLFSGIYEEDFDILNDKAKALGLDFVRKDSSDRWLLLRYVKNA